MTRLLPLLLLLPTLASAQGLTPLAPGQTGGGKTLLSLSLDTTGALITEDANTVSHVYWNGIALVDTKGNAWTMNGTVPQVTANPFTTTRYGAGPFSDSNYYTLGTGSDVLDFAGDFTACVVARTTPLAGNQMVVMDGDPAVASGYWIQFTSSLTAAFTTAASGPTYTTTTTTNAAVSGGPTVVCFGRSGSNQYVKLDLGTTATSGGAKTTAGTGAAVRLGATTGQAVPGTIYELYATTTGWNEASVVSIMQKVLGHLYGTTALTVSRTPGVATVLPRAADCAAGVSPCIFNVPANVARIEENGLLVEPARTNYALQSGTISTGTSATSPWALYNATATTVAGDPAGGSWAEVTSTASDGEIYSTFTTPSSTAFVMSVWMRKASGTGYAGVAVDCRAGNTASSCACVRSDGGACTATQVATQQCAARVSDLGTTPVRLSAIATCASAKTNPAIDLYPGQQGIGTGTTRFSLAQLEVGSFATSYIPTNSGTSASRAADQVSVANPIPTGTSKWCIAGDYKPENSKPWSTTDNPALWTMDAGSNAANYSYLSFSGVLYPVVSDGSGNIKYPNISWSPSSGSSHRVTMCAATGSTPSVFSDGTLISSGSNGTGSGNFATPRPSIYLGSSSGSSAFFGGYLKNIRVCSNAKTAKECK